MFVLADTINTWTREKKKKRKKMSGLIHTGLGSSSLIAHVLHSSPPPPANSFVIGPAVINTHTSKWLYFCHTSSVRSTSDSRGPVTRKSSGQERSRGTWAMTSAAGRNPLPESLSGPCRRLRYHEPNTHKVTSQVKGEDVVSVIRPLCGR